MYYNIRMRALSYMILDTDKYRKNIQILKDLSKKEMIAIIKANGYGLVDHIVADILYEEGVRAFGVSSLLEAMSLRKHGIKGDILVLGYIPIDELDEAKKLDIAISSISKDYIYAIDKDVLKGLKIHIAIDTGMHRIGLFPDEVEEVLSYLVDSGANVEGIFTHFARSDDDMAFTELQLSRFKDIVKKLDYDFKYIHTSNTDAAIDLKDDISTHVRCGIGLLGYSSKESSLLQSVSLHSTVTNCRYIKKGEGIGYGQTYTLDEDAYILTVAIGYADGLLRANKGREVYIAGSKKKIVGNICMDQMMCLSKEYVPINSDVEIFGEHISLYEMAKDLNTIPYEVLTNLSDRLERRYKKEDQVYLIYDPRFI